MALRVVSWTGTLHLKRLLQANCSIKVPHVRPGGPSSVLAGVPVLLSSADWQLSVMLMCKI